MAVSYSDFATKVAAQVSPSGAIFRTQNNADGTLAIYRSASGNVNVAGGPSSPWTLIYPRVTYVYVDDKVQLGDGSDCATLDSAKLIAGLQ